MRPDRRDDLRRRAQVRTVAGGLEEDDLTAGDVASHELPDFLRGNDVLAALEDQGRNRDLGKIGPVVGCEGDTREGFCDLRVGPTEAVGQFLSKLRTAGMAAMAPSIMGNPDRPELGEELTNSF